MLVNPTPKKKKSHLVRTGEDGLLFAELFMLMNPQKKEKLHLVGVRGGGLLFYNWSIKH
jgi:hypothetical protein